MFQSSRMASGSPLRHWLSACCPSSASTILKSNPSRMRRATLRITLESSTTMHVFITALSRSSAPILRPDSKPHLSRRLGVVADVEYAVDIEDHQELPFEPVHAGRYVRQPPVEIGRVD